MDKINEATQLLQDIGMPPRQYSELAAYTLLALAGIQLDSDWRKTTSREMRIHDILSFISTNYGKTYAENSRETIRKQCMHPFREAALITDNGKATNSPNYRYKLTDEAIELIKTIGTSEYEVTLQHYLNSHGTLVDKYRSKKRMQMMPVRINGENLSFSPGAHNELQKAIIEEFAPRFAPNCECLYVGDTIKKDLIKDTHTLRKLGFEITLHDKMPDVVLYCKDKNWLYFIEAVTSVGPMSPQRIIELNQLTRDVSAGKVFVTAFPNFETYKKFASSLAWETEVWISDMPEHMIHLNGDKFMGPRV